jgi:hypothetical protein
VGDRTPYAALQTQLVTTTRPTSRFIQDYNMPKWNFFNQEESKS